jgi:hypothetical protein
MGLKLTTRDPENFALLILEVADGTACSLLAFFKHWLMMNFFWKASLSIELPLTAHDPIHP